jgi:hypothetical protein
MADKLAQGKVKKVALLAYMPYPLSIAMVSWLRTGCRGGTPGWVLRPQTPLNTPFHFNVLSQLTIAIKSHYRSGRGGVEESVPQEVKPLAPHLSSSITELVLNL